MTKESSQHNKRKYWKWTLAVILMGGLGLGFYIYHWEYRKPVLEVYFFSLKRGRSIFVRTPENKTILIGGGQTSEVIRELTKVMPFYRRKIDYVVVPSANPAQIGGLVEILDRYDVGEIIMPKIMATSTALDAVMTKIRKNKIHTQEVERGDIVKIELDLNLNILFPYETYSFNKSSLPELAFSMSYNSTTTYFIGNLSKTIQKDILKNTKIEAGSNILEFYNSMTKNKNSDELVEAIAPIFTFSTKEKTAHAVSSGQTWEIIK